MGWTSAINAEVRAIKSHQNFSQRTHPTTPLDPKLKFVCVSYCLGAFGNVSLLHETHCKTGWTGAINAQVCAIKSFWNFSQQTLPIHPHWTLNSCLCASRNVWVYLVIFRYNTKLDAIRVEQVQLMHTFVPWNRIWIFRNQQTRSTSFDHKLMFWSSRSVWVHLAMFHYYTKLGAKRVELVQLMHKFVQWSRFGIFRNECTQPTPLDPKLMFWCVS